MFCMYLNSLTAPCSHQPYPMHHCPPRGRLWLCFRLLPCAARDQLSEPNVPLIPCWEQKGHPPPSPCCWWWRWAGATCATRCVSYCPPSPPPTLGPTSPCALRGLTCCVTATDCMCCYPGGVDHVDCTDTKSVCEYLCLFCSLWWQRPVMGLCNTRC